LSVGFFRELLQVSFHAYSPQSCALHFHFGGRKIEDFSCYFSTTWDTDDAVDETYEFLNLLLDACVRDGVIPIHAGDFNACVGSPCRFDETEHIGRCGAGQRNARGDMLATWVVQHGFQIMNRMDGQELAEENWTCIRTMDGAHVQMDFILTDMRLHHVSSWNDFAIGIGLDHRCVHCIFEIPGAKPKQRKRKRTLKRWRPFLDEEQQPSDFQICLLDFVRNKPEITFADLEHLCLWLDFTMGPAVQIWTNSNLPCD
jgi:hypothetical protein